MTKLSLTYKSSYKSKNEETGIASRKFVYAVTGSADAIAQHIADKEATTPNGQCPMIDDTDTPRHTSSTFLGDKSYLERTYNGYWVPPVSEMAILQEAMENETDEDVKSILAQDKAALIRANIKAQMKARSGNVTVIEVVETPSATASFNNIDEQE